MFSASSDAEGTFVMRDITEGRYVLAVRSGPYSSRMLPVTVEEGRTRAVEVQLTGAGSVYGAVAAPGGAWLPDVRVTLTDRSGTVVAEALTDSSGSYQMAAVAEGYYRVDALAAVDVGAASSAIEVDAGKAVAADLRLDGAAL